MDTAMFRSSAEPEPVAALGDPQAARTDTLRPQAAGGRTAGGAGRKGARLERRGAGWYATFIAIAIVLFVGIGIVSGVDAVAAIGLGYSGGVVLSERGLKRARTWTERLRLAGAKLRRRWLALHLGWKLAILAALVASQLYLHFLLILFPIAFLVPVVRRLWVQAADMLFGSWYWRTFGPTHRVVVASLRRQPGVRHVVGGARLTRIRYLRAWRLWRYDARYRDAETGEHEVSFIEPLRLWWRGELDGYVGRRLLGGSAHTRTEAKP
jgi:hypothetical protein